MDRRKFLKTAGVAAAASTALTAPAVAQSMPELKWRMVSSFPKSLDTLYGGVETIIKFVSEATDGKFQIQGFPGGEIVPPLQVADAVTDGTVELGQTALYYYWGKDPTFAFATAVPFGLNARLQNAWWYFGGGQELLNEFFENNYNFHAIAAGNTGAQMGGWFRKEIKSVDDLSGLKFRIGGFAGTIISRTGVVPQQLAGGDIYPALEKGTIDAAEWVGPYDDLKLGFNKVAPYYLYPGWWEGGPMLHVIVNKGKWEEMPKAYQAILTAACGYACEEMVAKYDYYNPAALRELVAGGAKLSAFPQDAMDTFFKAATDTYSEISATNANFKAVLESMSAVRREGFLWWQLTESTFDSFMMNQQRKKVL